MPKQISEMTVDMITKTKVKWALARHNLRIGPDALAALNERVKLLVHRAGVVALADGRITVKDTDIAGA